MVQCYICQSITETWGTSVKGCPWDTSAKVFNLTHCWGTSVKLLQDPGLEVIKLEFILSLKIKRTDWLHANTCPQAANHCPLLWVWDWTRGLMFIYQSIAWLWCTSVKILHDSEVHLSKYYRILRYLSKHYTPLMYICQSITGPWCMSVKVLQDPEVHLSKYNRTLRCICQSITGHQSTFCQSITGPRSTFCHSSIEVWNTSVKAL